MEFISLLGKWENEFGSIMEVTKLDLKTGVFSGIYSSHTGATGVYRFTGMTDIDPTEVPSQTVVFSISWRNIAVAKNKKKATADDPTFHWMSGFAGQLQVINSVPTIIMTYLLQKSTEQDDNWESTVVATSTFKPYVENK